MNGARRNAMAAGGAAKERLCRATGGRVGHADGGAVDDMGVDGAPSRSRGDKAPRGKDKAAGKGTTVNVIVAPRADGAAAPVPSAGPAAGLPPPPPPRPPMMPPAGAMPPGAGGPPEMMPRARGGRVNRAHPDEAQDKALFNRMFKQKAGMESAMGRAGRPKVRP